MTEFVIPAAAIRHNLIALGKTRSGKSSKLRVLAEYLLEGGSPVCILDPKGDWWGLKSSADGKRAGFPIVIFGGEHADVPINEHSGAHVAEIVATGNRPALIDLGGWMVGERTRFFVDFAAAFFRLARGARHLVIDEVHNFAPQGRIMDPDAGKMLHWANRLASEGSGKGITLYTASQRPQKVHKDFVTSCETLIACKVIHKLDRDAIKDWIDGCADSSKGKEVIADLAQLKKPEAWVWCPEVDFGPERITFPMFRTYDSFKPQSADLGKLKGWAEVDLEEVKAKLVAVVKESEANDPRRLKMEIARLTKLLDSEIKEDPKVIDSLTADNATLRTALNTATDAFKQADERLRKIATLADVRSPDVVVMPPPADSQWRPSPKRNGEKGDLSRAQQKLLDQLAWLEERGIYPPKKETLAAVAGVSPTSGGYFNNLGGLRTAGLIDYPQPGVVGFTNKGRAIAVVPDDPRPVHERWLGVVTAPQREILKALIELHPSSIEKEKLALRLKVSPTSGGYFNNLGRLRTLGAIDYPHPGSVSLTRHVMPN